MDALKSLVLKLSIFVNATFVAITLKQTLHPTYLSKEKKTLPWYLVSVGISISR